MTDSLLLQHINENITLIEESDTSLFRKSFTSIPKHIPESWIAKNIDIKKYPYSWYIPFKIHGNHFLFYFEVMDGTRSEDAGYMIRSISNAYSNGIRQSITWFVSNSDKLISDLLKHLRNKSEKYSFEAMGSPVDTHQLSKQLTGYFNITFSDIDSSTFGLDDPLNVTFKSTSTIGDPELVYKRVGRSYINDRHTSIEY